jgi:hypothetical protein
LTIKLVDDNINFARGGKPKRNGSDKTEQQD